MRLRRVFSSSTPGRFYYLSPTTGACTCPGWVARRRCRHPATRIFVEVESGSFAEPRRLPVGFDAIAVGGQVPAWARSGLRVVDENRFREAVKLVESSPRLVIVAPPRFLEDPKLVSIFLTLSVHRAVVARRALVVGLSDAIRDLLALFGSVEDS